MSYLKRDKKFNGTIIYHNMNGEYVNGWFYTDGEITGAVQANAESPDFDLVTTRSGNCYNITVEIYGFSCVGSGLYSYASGEWLWYEKCVPYVSDWYILTICDYGGPSSGGYDGSSGPGGTGGNSGGNGNTVQTPQARTDCSPSAASNSSSINNVLNKTVLTNNVSINQQINLLRNYANTASVEYCLSVSYDPTTGAYYVLNYGSTSSPQYIMQGTETSILLSYDPTNVYLLAHTHPNSSGANATGHPSPSPGDAIALAKAYKDGGKNVKANVAFGSGGAEYMIYVNNPTALADFCSRSINDSFFESNGYRFKSGSIWDDTYQTAYQNMVNQGFTKNDAQSYALQYVLDICSTGLKVYEKKNGEFKEQKTEKSGNNYLPKICQ